MNARDLKVSIIVPGPILPDPIEVLVVTRRVDAIKIVGAAKKAGLVCER